MLKWIFDNDGSWMAKSALQDDDGESFEYRIDVNCDGVFDTKNTCDALNLNPPDGLSFIGATLYDAKDYCEKRELAVRAEIERAKPPKLTQKEGLLKGARARKGARL